MKKNILYFSASFILMFFFLEILSRAIYPELSKNQIHKYVDDFRTISKSKNFWYKKFKINDGTVKYRHHKNTSNFYIEDFVDIKKRKNNIFLFGDSVTGGFGVNFQETFFYHAQSLLNQNLSYKDSVKIYSIARFGDNFRDMQKGLKIISKLTKKNDIILYQFNFNDILEVNYTPPNINTVQKQPSKIKIYFNDFRKSVLNSSTFLRLLQHKAGLFKWKLGKISIKNIILKQELFKKCGNLGFTSLGQYTYSYGAKQFEDKAKKVWLEFEKDLIELNEFLKLKELKFAVIISPISLQIPHHEKINHRDLNFECSTIDGRKKIKEILKKHNIDIIDPTKDFIQYAEITNQNDNNNLLFHPYDTNHPNEFGHLLIGKKLYSYLYNLLKS
ncbi:MAG: hypothetical protein CMF54_07170 [Legionellales bacterium]|nr:hypothetical protein [Legionellales bacterium]